jgi:hypothetical protein
MSELEDELDRLYGLPLDEFTAARNELAKRLRREGDADGAERVRGLGKPRAAAWAVNQLARRRRERVQSLLRAADELRASQERALAGGGGEELRSATQRERELVAALRRDARELLAESGRSPTDATLERVATTLSGAALDPATRPLLEAGRLSEEVAVSGFDAFAGMAPPTGVLSRPREKPSRQDEAAERRRAAEAAKRAAQLRKQATQLEKQAERAERAAARAVEEAQRARAAADEARREADEASEVVS